MKIGALTPCLNEVATIVFTIGSLLSHVDHYVVVDSGSTDGTLELIKSIFGAELASGKLVLIEYGPLPDFDISKPKNAAIAKLKELGCERFIRLDGDDVFFDAGAVKAVVAARSMADNVTMYTINHWELYQNQLYSIEEWLDSLKHPQHVGFWCMRMPPGGDPSPNSHPNRFDGSYGHARIYRTDGAVSVGKWTDEAWGKGPGEDIGHPGCPRLCIGNHDEDIVHYGWARPMVKKLAKGRIWTGEGKETADPRVSGLEKQWENVLSPNMNRMTYGMKYYPKFILFPFTKHPEVIGRLIDRVVEEYGKTHSNLPSI